MFMKYRIRIISRFLFKMLSEVYVNFLCCFRYFVV